MAGTFSFPVKYGYSLVGIVEKGPRNLLGRLVHVLHPHQDRCVVRTEDAHLLPPEIPAERATLASNLETAVNALWDSGFRLGETSLVVGFGAIGSLVARLIQLRFGMNVTVVDSSPVKRKLAGKMGFETSPPGRLWNSFDLAFHASGTSAGLQTAIDAVSFEGRVIELSWYGKGKVALSLGGSFHSGRKKLIGSQVSHIPAGMAPRWDFDRRRSLVFKLLENPVFDAHLSRRLPFLKLPGLYRKLDNPPPESLGFLVEYP